MKLHRILALENESTFGGPQLAARECRVQEPVVESPERFSGEVLSRPDVAFFCCAGLAHPLDAKVNSVRAIGQTNDLVEVECRVDAAQLRSISADVDRNRFVGEDLATAVGAEDAHLRLDLFARLTAPAHPVVNLRR